MRSSVAFQTLTLLVTLTFAYVRSEESHQAVAADSSLDSSEHQHQKRSAMLGPELTSSDSYAGVESYPYDSLPYLLEDSGDSDSPAKRSSLFRFGKRGTLFRFGKRGSLFRFGKRGSLFRFGKRGALLRYGKRGGTLFRFGRSGAQPSPYDDNVEDVRSNVYDDNLAKRSGPFGLYREAVYDSEGYPLYQTGSKRAVDGFHWGQEQS